MKKQIIISTTALVALWAGTAFAVINTANAKESKVETSSLIAVESPIKTTNPKPSASKNETVYVLTDENGNPKSKFIGSTIYDGAEELPFGFKVTYYLDGQEINGKDLAGKSGHIKIVYNYDSTAKYQGKFIPFLAVTGITLDNTKFSNVKVSNGKIISEASGNYIITGYSLAGVNANLNTDLLPESFTLEADTTNFKLENTYTVFMNEILADLDTSKLSDLDGIISSLNQLSDGVNKIVNGATDLSNGLGDALNGTKQLHDGSKTLASGLKDALVGSKKAAAGANELKTGLDTITDYNDSLEKGANKVIKNTLTGLNANPTIQYILGQLQITEITAKNYTTVLPQIIAIIKAQSGDTTEIENAKGLLDLSTGIIGYTTNVATAASGASELASGLTTLSAGLTKLSDGATTLSNGLGSLVEGETKLYDGSVVLKDGLTTLKTSGIDKLVNFANKDLASFTRNARATVNAAASYKNFGNTNAESVKFIIKTPSI